jgi:hypothetical protein
MITLASLAGSAKTNESLLSDSCFKNGRIMEYGWKERVADSKYTGIAPTLQR